MSSFEDVRKRATLPTRVVSLCLAGELVEKIAGLERQLADLKPATSLEGTSRQAIVEEIAATQAEMRESTVDFKLRALGARRWSKLWASCPAREENESDEAWDERIFPFYATVIAQCCVDPAMSVDEVQELATDLLHYRAFDQLVSACIGLNRGDIDIPNSDAASDLIENSELT